MRKLLLALLYAATFLTCYLPPFASACGDKLLMLGRGVKFGSISSSYHGSIIAYVPESVLQSAAINDAQFKQCEKPDTDCAWYGKWMPWLRLCNRDRTTSSSLTRKMRRW